jgi:GNAT superfamily N-acetyltransferase
MRLRPADVEDLPALDELLGRCSIATTSLRFNVPMPRLPRAYADAIARPDGVHVVVESAGAIVALGSCVGGELALLVEDAWQGRGVGMRLLDELVARSGRSRFTADVAYGNPRSLRMLKRLGRARVSAGPDGYRIVMQLATIPRCSTAPTTARTARSPALSRS